MKLLMSAYRRDDDGVTLYLVDRAFGDRLFEILWVLVSVR